MTLVSLRRGLTQHDFETHEHKHTNTQTRTLPWEHSSQPLRHLITNSSIFLRFSYKKTQNFDSTLKYECNSDMWRFSYCTILQPEMLPSLPVEGSGRVVHAKTAVLTVMLYLTQS